MSNPNGPALPLVSVCIIAYNQAEFVGEAIESAISQDYSSLEVIVADDGSTDNSPELISWYADRSPGILVPLIAGPNLGISGNCNRALQRCNGKYIVFMGGDDVLHPGKIKAQVAWLEADENRVLCGHRLEVFYTDKSKSPHPLNIEYRKGCGPDWLIRYGCPYGALSIMVRRAALPEGGFNETIKYVTDHLLWIESLMNGGQYGYVDAVLGRYRRHSSNITDNVQLCLSDVQKMFDYLEGKYPQYAKSIAMGRVNQVDMPMAKWMMSHGERIKGMQLLLKVALNSPYRILISLRRLLTGAMQ